MPLVTLSALDQAATIALNSSDGTPTVFNHSPPPVLIGGLIALFLSGAVFMQVIVYFQLYQSDTMKTKSMVLAVWVLDIIHSALVCTANWENLVLGYGAYQTLDVIQWSIAVTISLTALTTVIVHWFFIHRIYKLSRGNWFITAPLFTLALLRVASAFVTTAEMLRLRSYTLFIAQYTYIFTLGLAISASLDVLNTLILCYYLRKGRDGFARINHMIDLLTLYTVENGMLTCIATALSLFFWLFMRSNFVFLGMHLAINKLYANSLMASLNARKSFANRAQGSGVGYPLPVILPHPPQSPRNFVSSLNEGSPRMAGLIMSRPQSRGQIASKRLQVTVDVERTIQHDDTHDIRGCSPASEGEYDSPRKSGSDTLTDIEQGES